MLVEVIIKILGPQDSPSISALCVGPNHVSVRLENQSGLSISFGGEIQNIETLFRRFIAAVREEMETH